MLWAGVWNTRKGGGDCLGYGGWVAFRDTLLLGLCDNLSLPGPQPLAASERARFCLLLARSEKKVADTGRRNRGRWLEYSQSSDEPYR